MAREKVSPDLAEAVLALRQAEVEFVQAYGVWQRRHDTRGRRDIQRAERHIEAAERIVMELQDRQNAK